MDCCIFCEMPASRTVSQDLVISISCDNCGSYKISHKAFKIISGELKENYSEKRHLMSGYIREINENNTHLDTINLNNFRNLINNDTVPKTILEKADKLLLHILRKSKFLNDEIRISCKHPAIAYCRNESDLKGNFELLKQLGYITYSKVTVLNEEDEEETAIRCSLTVEGLKRADSIQSELGAIKQCFVSIWSDESMQNIYDNFITPAVVECGFSPVIINDRNANQYTLDEIITEIKKSKFIIADLTGHSNSVYYESGFAYGLGKEIIYICKEDNMLEKGFHINHNNILVWQEGNDLYAKLKNRIMSSIGDIPDKNMSKAL